MLATKTDMLLWQPCHELERTQKAMRGLSTVVMHVATVRLYSTRLLEVVVVPFYMNVSKPRQICVGLLWE